MSTTRTPFLLHLLAGIAALVFAGLVSRTEFRTTGLQFTGPLVVIMMVHFAGLGLRGGLLPGFSITLMTRSVGTAVTLAALIFLGSVLAPQPAAAAEIGEILGVIAMIVFCVAIIAIVAGIGALFLLLVVRLVQYLANGARLDDDHKGGDSRLLDVGSLLVVGTLLGATTLEGIWPVVTFDTAGRAQATQVIEADAAAVWAAMDTATSPEFPLPNWLAMFPQPVAVSIDEGVGLGALRQVEFQGREGQGQLTLQVTDRTDAAVTFTVLSDTTPYAEWVAYRTLTYRVTPVDGGTELTTTLTYDRGLTPRWFFGPATKAAASLAMDVLARDVKTRSEG